MSKKRCDSLEVVLSGVRPYTRVDVNGWSLNMGPSSDPVDAIHLEPLLVLRDEYIKSFPRRFKSLAILTGPQWELPTPVAQ